LKRGEGKGRICGESPRANQDEERKGEKGRGKRKVISQLLREKPPEGGNRKDRPGVTVETPCPRGDFLSRIRRLEKRWNDRKKREERGGRSGCFGVGDLGL